MTDFKTIALAEIHPDPEQPRKFFDQASLDELTLSVKKDGVLEPIMIRPNKTNAINKKLFIIVYGERRFKAATAAGLREIPAQIRDITPEEAFEFQITENLHRKDVHPMEEANSYERLQKKDPVKNTVKELAVRFAKSEIYVTQRLSFNNLIPDFQKEFYENKFSTGHAILLSRLTKDDQFLVKKEARGGYYFATVYSLNEWIERNIMHNLSKATFKQDDATLFPEAGPCITCTKRSGSNLQLFPDVKEKDCCFDKKCFEKKSDLHFNFRLKEIIETRPEVNIISNDSHDANKPAMELLKSLNIKILKSEDWQRSSSNYGNFTRKAKGFHINGYYRGEIVEIYLKGKDKNGNKIAPEKPAKEQIAGIQEREKRAKELDQVKVWDLLRKHFNPAGNATFFKDSDFTEVEREAITASVYNKLDFTDRKDFLKTFKLTEGKYASIDKATIKQIIRYFFLSVLPPATQYGNYTPDALICLKMAGEYFPTVLKDIQNTQAVVSTKRQVRVSKRIQDLRDEEKAKPAVKAPSKKTKLKVPSKSMSKTRFPKIEAALKSKPLPKNAKKKNAK